MYMLHQNILMIVSLVFFVQVLVVIKGAILAT